MALLGAGWWVVSLVTAGCSGNTEDTGDPQEPEVVRSVDLTGAMAFVFIRPDQERTIQGAGQGELFKVLDDGSTERLFPAGWQAEEYGQGPGRFLVRLAELHWFEALDPEAAAHPGLWCRFVSFPTDAQGEQPLTCHLPLEVLDDCDDPEDDPSEIGMCWEFPNAYDIGPDDTVWALWQADGYNVYAWTDTEAIRVTPAGAIAPDFVGGPPFTAVDGGVLMNATDVRLETYWLRAGGGGADLAMLEQVHQFSTGGTRSYLYGGRVLAWTYDGDGVFDASTRSFVPFVDFATFEGATPSANPVIDLVDAGRVYVRAGSSSPYETFLCDEDAHCVSIPEDDPRRLALLGATYTLSDGEVTYLKSGTGEYFMAGDVLSDELGAQWLIVEVRLLGGKLHFESIDESNVAHLYRVDFADGVFTYTESDTWGPETTAIIPLAWPEP